MQAHTLTLIDTRPAVCRATNAPSRVAAGVDVAAAAGIPIVYGTADLALRHRARLAAGQTLLVLGASGGVGTAAVQVRDTQAGCSWLPGAALWWAALQSTPARSAPCHCASLLYRTQ